jgi:hypothetical protein
MVSATVPSVVMLGVVAPLKKPSFLTATKRLAAYIINSFCQLHIVKKRF